MMCAAPSGPLSHRTGGSRVPQLQCRIEFHTWIASEFHWKEVSDSLDTIIPISDASDGGDEPHDVKPQTLGEVDLEIILTTNVSRRYRHIPPDKIRTNEHYLLDDAFHPRQFKVRFERGCFSRLWGFSDAKSEFRLIFDPSPFPQRDMWKRPDRGPDAYEFWQWKVFVEGDVIAAT